MPTLMQLASLFPDAHFGNALRDLEKLGLDTADKYALSSVVLQRRDRRWAEEVAWTIDFLEQKGLKNQNEHAYRIVSLDVCAGSSNAAQKAVRKAHLDYRASIGEVPQQARLSAMSKVIFYYNCGMSDEMLQRYEDFCREFAQSLFEATGEVPSGFEVADDDDTRD